MTAPALPVLPVPAQPAPGPQAAGDETPLVLAGGLDEAGADALRALLGDAFRPGRRLVLDLSGVQHLSAVSLAVLIGAHRRLSRSGGALVLASPSPAVVRVLRVSGLHRVVPVL